MSKWIHIFHRYRWDIATSYGRDICEVVGNIYQHPDLLTKEQS